MVETAVISVRITNIFWKFPFLGIVKIPEDILSYKITNDLQILYLGLLPAEVIHGEDLYLFKLMPVQTLLQETGFKVILCN